MTSTQYWWLALLLGLVVALVVVVLLHLLLRQVHRVEHAAAEVWQAGKEVASHTANTWLLEAASHQLGLLAQEAAEHRRLLEPAGGDDAR